MRIVATDVEYAIGNWQIDQIKTMHKTSNLVSKRSARKPPATPPMANSQKKLLPIAPNSCGVSLNSSIIGTATRPSAILSMKLIIMKAASASATFQPDISLMHFFRSLGTATAGSKQDLPIVARESKKKGGQQIAARSCRGQVERLRTAAVG